jgi:3-hydroxy-9,10-secoandrosta-1,3,5(10)-triene-9,17-dione monooxygenase reductase component
LADEAQAAPVEELLFREAISHFATGVTVITTLHEGKPAGMTASAVTSVSLDPVLLLVCINNNLPTHTAIEQSRRFVVNVLGQGQEQLALHFARPSADKFADITLRDHELPILDDAIAHFVCDVHERFPGGDHSIFIGQVLECGSVRGKKPLVYFKSKFGAIHDPELEFLNEAVGWDVGSLGGIGNISVEPR